MFEKMLVSMASAAGTALASNKTKEVLSTIIDQMEDEIYPKGLFGRRKRPKNNSKKKK